VRNLVDNAFKYTAAGGVTVAADPDERRVRIAVRDTGAGIPVSERERIFEEFYQIGNPSATARRDWGWVWRSCGGIAQLLELGGRT